MGRFFIGLILGLAAGAASIYWIFILSPHSSNVPGMPVKSPDSSGVPAGTAQLVVKKDLINDALQAIFNEMNPPSFQLGPNSQTADLQSGQACSNRITILPEGSGVQTNVHFENGKVTAPLAFTGSYASFAGCLQFSGWAQSAFDLKFDRSSQTVYGQINVETINLDGVNPVFTGIVTPIVQTTINTRVNPIKIMDGRQLAIDLPIKASNADLRASVEDVRAEVKDDALDLYVIYDFTSGPPASPPGQ
jgi:hypothetical protein